MKATYLASCSPIDCIEARRFTSCYPLVATSEMFRFPGHNIRTNDSLQKSQYIRNLFAYYDKPVYVQQPNKLLDNNDGQQWTLHAK